MTESVGRRLRRAEARVSAIYGPAVQSSDVSADELLADTLAGLRHQVLRHVEQLWLTMPTEGAVIAWIEAREERSPPLAEVGLDGYELLPEVGRFVRSWLASAWADLIDEICETHPARADYREHYRYLLALNPPGRGVQAELHA